jgi:hypothetical protein
MHWLAEENILNVYVLGSGETSDPYQSRWRLSSLSSIAHVLIETEITYRTTLWAGIFCTFDLAFINKSLRVKAFAIVEVSIARIT